MAPVGQSDHDIVENQLKDVIQDLYHVMVQVHAYDVTGKPSAVVVGNQITSLNAFLDKVKTSQKVLPSIPSELIKYVDGGRNPDIYTREFVELSRKGNQLMKGKMEAFGDFRDVLAGEMQRAMPELKEDVDRVLDSTGGRRV